MLVRSWSVLFGLLAVSAVATAYRRHHYSERIPDRSREYADKRRDYADGKEQPDKTNADKRSDAAASKVSDSAVAQSISVQDVAVQSVQDNSVGALASFAELLESSKPRPELPKNIKTYIVTKKVPVPYPVQYETRVPYPIKVPIRRPYTVYVPKPYYVEVPKPVPYTVKVPVPQPYHFEKHIPYPFKVPVDKPIPIQIPKPYPVYIEKKVPVAVEKQVPIPVNIPVERPVPVPVPVENPISVSVEKQVLLPIKFPVESSASVEKPSAQVSGSTNYEVSFKNGEPQVVSTENHEYSTALRTSNDFTPSPYDAFASSFLAEGKQKLISIFPGGQQNSTFYSPKQEYTFEPLTLSHTQQGPQWADSNSTDWIPRYVTAVHTRINHPEPQKLVAFQQENETKPTQVDNNNFQQDVKQEGTTNFQQSQVYNFVPIAQKLPSTKFQEHSVPLQVMQQGNNKFVGDGNYQFYNVHTLQGPRAEALVSGISYQRFQAEPKSSVEPPTQQWVQVQQNQVPQSNYPQEQASQQGKTDDRGQQQQQQQQPQQQVPTFVPQPSSNNFITSQDFEQFKQYQKDQNKDRFQVSQHFVNTQTYKGNEFSNNFAQDQNIQHQNVQQHHNVPQEHSQPDLNQFNNQNFPQLQQYQQQLSSQPQQYQQHFAGQQLQTTNYQNQPPAPPVQQFHQQAAFNPTNQHQQQQQHQSFQQDQSQHYHQAPPQQQVPQETQYIHQTVIPAHQVQNTFEQKDQLGDQDVKMFLGHEANGSRRRQRHPSNQQIGQSEQYFHLVNQQASQPDPSGRINPPQPPIPDQSLSTPSSNSTEHPPRLRKTRRRNRKRNNGHNNNAETTTVNTVTQS